MTKLLPPTGEVAIGRSTACDFRINDASISRRHATLRMSPLEIVDEGSRNGTRVKGKAVASGTSAPVTVGDAIYVGEAAILLQRVAASERRHPITPLPELEAPMPPVDAECARSARTGAPFAVVYVAVDSGDAREALQVLRTTLRTTDVVKSDGPNGCQLLLADTRDVALTVSRLAEHLRQQHIRARFGVARYPHDGVVGEPLVAHAYVEAERAPAAAPSPMDLLLEIGNGGTGFLDEIGELPLGVQAKLLRVIEERIVRRGGATAGKKIDVRFVFATTRDLLAEVDAGRFRGGLYYRINGVTISIPPLRERQAEIVALARAFGSRARGGAPVTLGNEVINALCEHGWPGNIRELRNTIERAVLLSSGGAVRPSHLVLVPPRDVVRESQNTLPLDRITYDEEAALFRNEPTLRPSESMMRRSSGSLANEVADLERKRIVETLEKHGGNQTQVARELGMSRGTLIARMEQYGLPRPRKRDND